MVHLKQKLQLQSPLRSVRFGSYTHLYIFYFPEHIGFVLLANDVDSRNTEIPKRRALWYLTNISFSIFIKKLMFMSKWNDSLRIVLLIQEAASVTFTALCSIFIDIDKTIRWVEIWEVCFQVILIFTYDCKMFSEKNNNCRVCSKNAADRSNRSNLTRKSQASAMRKLEYFEQLQ